MSQKNFNTDWLNERFKYDNAARNQTVELAFQESFKGKPQLNIVDIGSGTGSNFLYFAEKLPCDQNWVLIEQDAALCEAGKVRIQSVLASGFESVETNPDSFEFRNGSKKISIKIICDSFYNIAQLIDLQQVDVVMAAAVFDVLSKEQFGSLMNQLSGKGLSLFSTMNYSGMHFLPVGDLDAEFVNYYERHMLRPQDFGVAMGKNCLSGIESYFQLENQEFLKGKSLWNLDPKASKMHSFILGFMEKSITEMLNNASEQAQFEKWLSEKRTLSQQGKLHIEVSHFDFLIPI